MTPSFISVLLPYRNAAATLAAALDGLLAGSDPAVEVLAVDDGSCDAGSQLVQTWARRDARLRPLRSPGSGLVDALNFALGQARGGLLARMDADDVCHPERLARQRAHLLGDPRLDVLGCQVAAFADGADVGAGLARYVAWQNGLISAEDHARELFVEAPLCHPSIMLRRESLCAVGGYRRTDGPEDYDLFLRLDAAGARMAKLPEVLLRWRHQPGRATFRDPRYAPERFRRAKAPFLAARVQAQGKPRCAIWGAGPTGKRLARELEGHGLRPALFIDIDPRKIGRTARTAPIAPSAALDAARDALIIAVGAPGARELIRPALAELGFVEGENAWFAA